MTMKKTIKKQWLKALRSGDYKQGKGRLCTGNGEDQFCCLGVLADLICDNYWVDTEETQWSDGKERRVFMLSDDDESSALLSPEILKQAGLENYQQTFLAARNDNGVTFEQIADLIEDERY